MDVSNSLPNQDILIPSFCLEWFRQDDRWAVVWAKWPPVSFQPHFFMSLWILLTAQPKCWKKNNLRDLLLLHGHFPSWFWLEPFPSAQSNVCRILDWTETGMYWRFSVTPIFTRNLTRYLDQKTQASEYWLLTWNPLDLADLTLYSVFTFQSLPLV